MMKVVFIPDYRVSLAEKIIPATDLSEQISTAGKEASGTGNMKMALNGAVMIGTYDGTNLDMSEEIGVENMFLFGLKSAQIRALREERIYRPRELCEGDARLKRLVEVFRSDLFSRREAGFWEWVERMLLDEEDEYAHLADLPAYLVAQKSVETAFCDGQRWARMSILNSARIGMFSSDRAIAEYAGTIWGLTRQESEAPDGAHAVKSSLAE
jgi:starch phosphorylase